MQLVAITLVYTWGVLLALSQKINFSWTLFSYAWLVAILISVSIHYVNEYADVETDRLTKRTPFSGGSGALVESDLPRTLALKGAFAFLITGILIASLGWFLHILSLSTLIVLIIATFLGWGYSLPPLALAWRGLGELDNAFLGGVLLPVYGYLVFTNQIDVFVISSVIPFGLLAFVNLLATTWADKWADAQVGKYSLATRYPAHRLRVLYALVVGAAYLFVFWLAPYPPLIMWASLLTVPISVTGFLRYTRQTNPAPSVAAMIAFLMVQLMTWPIFIER
jgi:1,4-dihydroxy-2-naphthoate octaprenyltransferase